LGIFFGRKNVRLDVNGNLSPLGKTVLSKDREISLTNDTMTRRVDMIAKDLEDQLVAKKLWL